MEIMIYGLASKKTIANINLDKVLDKNINLMNFLLSNNITIASSCNGEGLCHKCVVNQHVISCQMTLQQFIDIKKDDLSITVSYL